MDMLPNEVLPVSGYHPCATQYYIFPAVASHNVSDEFEFLYYKDSQVIQENIYCISTFNLSVRKNILISERTGRKGRGT